MKRAGAILDGATRKQSVTSRIPVKLEGLAAEEADAEIDDPRQGRVRTITRVLVTRDRAYTVIAGGPKDKVDLATVRAFVDSVKPAEVP